MSKFIKILVLAMVIMPFVAGCTSEKQVTKAEKKNPRSESITVEKKENDHEVKAEKPAPQTETKPVETKKPIEELTPETKKDSVKVASRAGTISPKRPAPKSAPKPSVDTAPVAKTPVAKPAPSPSPAPSTSPSTSWSAERSEMLGYINAERQKAGLRPLQLDSTMNYGAWQKSKDMAVKGYFGHTSPTYGSPFDHMKNLGITFRAAGENLALNTTVQGAFQALMNSPGHRANILKSEFNILGLGLYKVNGKLYVTQWFVQK